MSCHDCKFFLRLATKWLILGQKTFLGPKRATLGNQGHQTAYPAAKWPPIRKPKVSRVTSGYGGLMIQSEGGLGVDFPYILKILPFIQCILCKNDSYSDHEWKTTKNTACPTAHRRSDSSNVLVLSPELKGRGVVFFCYGLLWFSSLIVLIARVDTPFMCLRLAVLRIGYAATRTLLPGPSQVNPFRINTLRDSCRCSRKLSLVWGRFSKWF